ncbi:MAG: nitrous oxide reductase family maturation protein NosD [Candidatus Eisenbacteria bacterium]|nr:nitrous oxide reductase family maturation protein NosD [Candidatus Eisenbacteria bacterium]
MTLRAGGLAALLLLAAASAAGARETLVPPGRAADALAAAAPGDTIVLARGVHSGPLVVAKAIVLRGEAGAVVDGGGRGSVLTVGVSGAVVEDLVLRGSGRSVMDVDAGVRVLLGAHVRLSRLVLTDVLYGVYGERADDLRIEQVDLTGRCRPRAGRGEGNGVHLWYCARAVVRECRVDRFMDALYLSFAHGATIEDNLLYDSGRYGFHSMYCQNGRLARNRFTRNIAGCALMFSNHLVIERNAFVRNQGPRTYGLLLRDCSDGRFEENRIAENTVGVFLDGSNRNQFRGNLVQDNGWGVLMFASCAKNVFTANDFVQNDYPVALDMRRTDNRFDDGRMGNWWSAHAAYDLDDDGAGDTEYAPVGAFAFLSKRSPDLTLLAHSPAVAALGVAEQVFPALRPSEAVDRFPRVRPVPLAPDSTPALPGGEDAPRRGNRNWAGMIAFGTLAAIGAAALASSGAWRA